MNSYLFIVLEDLGTLSLTFLIPSPKNTNNQFILVCEQKIEVKK
jgi:hypothetical protein